MISIDEQRLITIQALRGQDDDVITISLMRCIASTAPGTPAESVFVAVCEVVKAIREAARQDALELLTVPGVQ